MKARLRGGDRLGDERRCILCEQPFRRRVSTQTICRRPSCSREKKRLLRTRKRTSRAKPPTLNYIYKRDRGRCQLCGEKVDLSYKHPDPLSASMDHIVPIAAGGEDTAKNVQLAHLGCNLEKSTGG